MMQSKKYRYKEVIKAFFLSFKRLSLYSANHPLSKDILKNLFKIFEELLKDQEEVLIVSGANTGEMIISQERLGADVLGASEIYERFKAFKLDGVAVLRGLTYEELVDFVTAMAKASSMDGGKVVDLPLLLQEGSDHIKIRKVRYEKVEEDEKIVSKGSVVGSGGDGTGGFSGGFGLPSAAAGRDDFAAIKNFLTGKTTEAAKDAGFIFGELDHNVSKVTQVIIESIKESGDFESVIRKFVHWLSRNIAPIVVEKKKDPSKFIQSIFDSFKKEGVVADSVRSDKVIEECSDEIKMAMIEEAFVSQKHGTKKATTTALKILSDEKDQMRILPQLENRFVNRGIESEEAQQFVEHVKVELAKDEEVVISKKKLQKLTQLAERFEDELGKRVKDATCELRVQNQRLAVEKERSEGIMHHLAQGLVVVDKNGKIVMMNPAAQKLLDAQVKETVGKSLAESLKKEHLMAMAKGYGEEVSNGPITKEIELASKDEMAKKVLRASSAVVEDENGKTVGMVSVLSDVTHEKEVEEMKSHFVSLVTHELRTPVVTIQKSLELVLGGTTGAINEDQKKFLSVSQMNLMRLNNLINDLLDMSKLEAGKFLLRPLEFDMRDMISDVKTSLMGWANDKKIIIHLELGEAAIKVYADRDRLSQVLINLVSNALKFTPSEGEIFISLKAYEKMDHVCQEPCVEVAVVDSGIGIEPKDFKRIFNKFEQVSLVGPSTGAGGTGLGLPIAKEIVCLHGGNIWVESQKDKGSRFIFVIPKKYKDTTKKG
ncbi:MAG: ATP-binding protein [Candidatus Omnitrophota bacterium]